MPLHAPHLGLCWRCEHRARAHETGLGPRYECTSFLQAVHGCYMYRPVCPVIIAPNAGDERPVGGPYLIAARAHFVRIATDADVKLAMRKVKGGHLMFYRSAGLRAEGRGAARRGEAWKGKARVAPVRRHR